MCCFFFSPLGSFISPTSASRHPKEVLLFFCLFIVSHSLTTQFSESEKKKKITPTKRHFNAFFIFFIFIFYFFAAVVRRGRKKTNKQTKRAISVTRFSSPDSDPAATQLKGPDRTEAASPRRSLGHSFGISPQRAALGCLFPSFCPLLTMLPALCSLGSRALDSP